MAALNSVQQKAERPATLRDQPFKSGRFLTGVPADTESTTDTSQHKFPSNLPVPEPFWMGCGLSEASDAVATEVAAVASRARCPNPWQDCCCAETITERLCPEGFRKGYSGLQVSAINESGRLGSKALEGTPEREAVTRRLLAPFTKALRRQPNAVRGCFDGSAVHGERFRYYGLINRKECPESNLRLVPATFKTPSYGRCGVHNRPKLRAATSNPRSDQPPSTWWVALQEVASHTWPKGCMALSHPVGG